MPFYTTVKGILLGAVLAVPSVVHAEVGMDPNCWRTEEVDAARFEDFRLKLLVGALNCKNYLPGAATSYNSFLQTKKDVILANMYVVRAHFVREAGVADGADQFANYETLAGNKYSSPTFDRAKCETIDTYLKMGITLSDTDLVKMVAMLSPGPLPSGCKVAPRPAPVVVEEVPTPPPALAPVPVATMPITDAQRVAASTAATRQLIASHAVLVRPVAPAMPVAAAPAAPAVKDVAAVPATLVITEPAKADVVAAPVPPNAAQALAEAAKALALAAAAMQATH